MPRWTKVFVEVYGVGGYQGRWEGTPAPKRGGWDPSDLPRLATWIRMGLRHADATLLYGEDGEVLVIGLFDGVDPPSKPRKGRAIVPDTFEDHM